MIGKANIVEKQPIDPDCSKNVPIFRSTPGGGDGGLRRAFHQVPLPFILNSEIGITNSTNLTK